MKKSEFLKIKLVIETAYSQWQATEDVEDTWFVMLKDLDFNLTYNAVKRLIMTSESQWPPSIGAIRKEASRLANPQISITAEEAWGEVERNVRRVGYVGCPKWSHEAIKQAVEAIGWRVICLREETDIGVRAHFFRIYGAVQKRQQENDLLPQELQILIEDTVKKLPSVYRLGDRGRE